jgi:hypothetical protein
MVRGILNGHRVSSSAHLTLSCRIVPRDLNPDPAMHMTEKLTFVSDRSDQGPRQRWTFHKVQINLNGDVNLMGEKASILSCKGSVLADTTQAAGQEYYKTEMM